MSPRASAETALLLRALHAPVELDEPGWDGLLRRARASGLHARLAAAQAATPGLPDVVRRHFLSASRIAAYRRKLMEAELFQLAALCDTGFPVVVLKGAAYALQQRRMATGRFVSDVDLLVPAAHLRTMEQGLRAAGWRSEALSPYDERYYRDWSHETPPLRFPGHSLELDLHHAITPVTGSLAFDPAPLFARCEPIEGTPFHALAAEDQVLHACVHAFHDGDLALRVREVVDIDGLVRELAVRTGFWDRLLSRAEELGLGRPLWYGLHFARQWLDCPIPGTTLAALTAPATPIRRIMDVLVPLAMLPGDLDGPPTPSVRLARTALLARYHRRRMPARLLLPHLVRKTMVRLGARIEAKKEAPDDGAS